MPFTCLLFSCLPAYKHTLTRARAQTHTYAHIHSQTHTYSNTHMHTHTLHSWHRTCVRKWVWCIWACTGVHVDGW